MKPEFKQFLEKLNNEKVLQALPGIRRGFEKECLRVNDLGDIAMSSHPSALGSNLTHPMITTDYSEALLEFITPPLSRVTDLFSNLLQLHQYTYASLKDEFLWAFSMPCHLPIENTIPIARYGSSNLGLLKYYYRVGLGHRYGKRMQMIAGVHYNFSFSLEFWRAWQEIGTEINKTQTEKDFISENYLGMIRNALRFGWILPLLFGASPAIDSEFITDEALQNNNAGFQKIKGNTLFLPYATSLRLSDFGYHNKATPIVEVSYNSFPEFIETLHLAVHTKDEEFAKIGVKINGEYRQLSDCVLQVEDEHYAALRPKRMTGPGERMFPALANEGIEYVEVRALDLDPFSPIGVEPESVYFLDTFLLLCLLLDSKEITKEEKNIMAINHQRVVKEGRKPGLKLMTLEGQERLLQDLCHDMLDAMEAVARYLDKAYNHGEFSAAVKKAKERLNDFNQLASAKVLKGMQEKEESHCEFANRWSRLHEAAIKKMPFNKGDFEYYKNLAEQSIIEQKALERENELSFDEYLKRFLKT